MFMEARSPEDDEVVYAVEHPSNPFSEHHPTSVTAEQFV